MRSWRGRPAVALIDELAHTNAPGSKHPKRYLDVQELLENGIDVYTTLNIQHFESLNDVVERITGVRVQETLPDTFLDRADEVQVIDIPFEELSERLKEGKVYIPKQAERAMENFFRRGNLVALRELTLTHAAHKVDAELLNYMRAKAISGPWPAGERVMVCVGASPYARQLLRKAYLIAKDAHAEWYAVYVSTPSLRELSDKEKAYLTDTLNLAEELGAKTSTLSGSDIADEILSFAREHNIAHIVIGKPLRSKLFRFWNPSPAYRLLHAPSEFDLHLVTPTVEEKKEAVKPTLEAICDFSQRLLAHHMHGRCYHLVELFPSRIDRPRVTGFCVSDCNDRQRPPLWYLAIALCFGRQSARLRFFLYGPQIQPHHEPCP